MTATQNEDQTGAREPWKNYLDEEIQDAEDGSIDQAVPILIRDMLEPDSASEAAIKKAALQLAEYDKSVLLSYDFMTYTIVDVARLIPYDDERQDRIIQLLKHLRDIPTTGPEHMYALRNALDQTWNGTYPAPRPSEYDGPSGQALLQKKCDEWINYSAFKARTLAAGVCADYEDWSFNAPTKDIPDGLILRDNIGDWDAFEDCTLMVAAQYILLAGEALKSCFIKWGRPDYHKPWIEGFRMATTWESPKEATKVAVKQAYEKALVLWPEVLPGDAAQVTKEAEKPRTEISKADDS